jgi:hypothetical protein
VATTQNAVQSITIRSGQAANTSRRMTPPASEDQDGILWLPAD